MGEGGNHEVENIDLRLGNQIRWVLGYAALEGVGKRSGFLMVRPETCSDIHADSLEAPGVCPGVPARPNETRSHIGKFFGHPLLGAAHSLD